MLTVILIWLYVIITTYLMGYGFLTCITNWPGMFRRKNSRGYRNYTVRFKESYIMAGVAAVTVYAEICSLFGGVGLVANLILMVVCLFIALCLKEELISDFWETVRLMLQKSNGFIYLAVFLLMAYGTSHGIMHYDSDLYHAQAIHWIEDYGIIKGLGNLHVRLAYNSAAFPLSALYSMHFLGGQSYHVMAGFFALLLAWQCVDIKNAVRRGHPVISDFARLAAIYYLFTIFDEMVSPASDYFLSTLVFYIMIHWLDMYVKHERSYFPYIMLALMGVFAITIKLSAAPMVLLIVVPVYMLFKDRTKEKTAAFWVSVCIGLLIVLPFLIRNVIISGWLLYPVTFLDIFSFGFKIPKGAAEFDALQIKVFGRGYNDVAAFANVSFREWVPHWFEGIGGINKIMLILDIVSIGVYFLYLAYFVILAAGRKVERFKKIGQSKVFSLSSRSMLSMADFLTMGATLIGCLLFWFFSAPLIRYGVVYVWLTPAIMLGRIVIHFIHRLSENNRLVVTKVLAALFLLWICYKGLNLVLEDVPRYNAGYLVDQQDYGTYATNTFKINGTTFYYPTEGDQVGYYPFPAATYDVTGEVEMMGENLKDGFISIDK